MKDIKMWYSIEPRGLPNDETEEDVERATPKKRYTSPEERKQTIDEMKLVPKMYV